MRRLSPAPASATSAVDRPYLIERVGDAAVVQLYADGFGDLPLREKTLIWHLTRAAIAGRDIFYDQRYAHNLEMRDVLEAIVMHPSGVEAATLEEIRRYTKLFWINTGPHNNLTARKFVLTCTPQALTVAAHAAARAGATLPLRRGETIDALIERLSPMFFDPEFDPTVTSKTPPDGKDILTASANNLHAGVTMADLERFEERHPLNSRLIKRDGALVEEVYRVGGLYSAHVEEIVRHLDAARAFATPLMADALDALIRLYRTGDDRDRERYDIAWVHDRESPVDTVNGFIEVYLDARGVKGAWEAMVWYVNPEKTAEIRRLAEHAQWFEDRMPCAPEFRKREAKGVSASAIDVVVETGDSGPVTPIGVNLPNDQSIRERYGSKSISLTNVREAYDKSTPPEFRTEFSWTDEEAARATTWGPLAAELTTNLHEVIGHGSGQIDARLQGNPQAALKEHYSAIEEARADLVALYFLPDAKLAELGLVPPDEHDAIVRAEYESYARTALVQLRRVRHGDQLEEDHMRNRQLIVHWLMAHTHAIDVRTRDGKTYYVMTDADAFRDGVGGLLGEVQRIKGEGDYTAARALVERYGVRFDPARRDEVVARVDRLDLPSYTAFVMPSLAAVRNEAGEIVDVTISYPLDFEAQMLEYSAATRHLRSGTPDQGTQSRR
jgi:dipeptidyl-peptidase III